MTLNSERTLLHPLVAHCCRWCVCAPLGTSGKHPGSGPVPLRGALSGWWRCGVLLLHPVCSLRRSAVPAAAGLQPQQGHGGPGAGHTELPLHLCCTLLHLEKRGAVCVAQGCAVMCGLLSLLCWHWCKPCFVPGPPPRTVLQGYRGLFSGWHSSLVQDCAFSATQFVAYEKVGCCITGKGAVLVCPRCRSPLWYPFTSPFPTQSHVPLHPS